MTSILSQRALAGPRLPALAIWTWRILLLLLVLHWLINIALLTILAPALGGDKQSSNHILQLIHPQFLFEFFRSRITLWESHSAVTIVAFVALVLDVLVSPLTWFAFQRRHSARYRVLLVWRLLVTGSVVGTDIALINGNFNLRIDFSLVGIGHLVVHDSFLAVLVFLMLLIAPESSPLEQVTLPPSSTTPTKPSSPSAPRRTTRSVSAVAPSAGLIGTRDSISTPELRSQRYASRVITNNEQHQLQLMSAFQHEFLAHPDRPFSSAHDVSTVGVAGGRSTRPPKFHAPPPPAPPTLPATASVGLSTTLSVDASMPAASHVLVPVMIPVEAAHAIMYDARFSVYTEATPAGMMLAASAPSMPRVPGRPESVYHAQHRVVPEHVPVYQVAPTVPSEVGVQAQVSPTDVSHA